MLNRTVGSVVKRRGGRVWGGGCKVLLQGRANQADTGEIGGGRYVRTGMEGGKGRRNEKLPSCSELSMKIW